MKLHLTLSLRRALLAAMAAVCTLSSTSFAGVVDGRYDLQYYLDFCRNKGMFATGATNIEVFFKEGTSITNNTIPLMPNMDSYGRLVNSVGSMPGYPTTITSGGGTNLVSSQFVYGAGHVFAKVGNKPVGFLTENGSPDHTYDSANGERFGSDSAMQRLTKLVTEVAYTPLASADFMRSVTTNSTWLYRIGNGGAWSENKSINTGENSLGGVVNLSGISYNESTGEWKMEGYARYNDQAGDDLTPLEIGTYSGDSGSPYYAWDDEKQQFVFVGAHFGGDNDTSLPKWYVLYYNPTKAAELIDSYSVAASFSGADTILWSASDATSGQGTLTQGADTVVDYTGKGSGNSLGDSLGLTFSTDDTATTRELQLQGDVNMGAGALTFENGKWRITETDGNDFSLSSAGLDISEDAEVTWELTGVSGQEIRKVGEGILTIAGSGDNAASLVVGGGTTVYNVVRDENGNITGCTLGNAGETRLNRTDGYAASSVRLEGGVAIVVLMADNQFKTNSVAGDTFSFGNAGGLLNLNGHDLSWGVINQDGSGTGARIGNFTPSGEATPGLATFTYTGTSGTFAGSFMDEGADGAQLAVKYNSEGGTWKLTGQSNNAGGYTVEAGTMVLEGSLTPHVLTTDWSDWTYAGIETSGVTVKNGATFQLSHHALLKGDVTVESGGAFILNQTVNAASESISGSRRQDMASLGITSLVGNVTLNGAASMTVNTDSPVATTMKGNITGDTSGNSFASFTKTGSGNFVVNGQMGIPRGTVEQGGLIVTDSTNFLSTWSRWTIKEEGFLAVQGIAGQTLAYCIDSSSTGVLALTTNQTTELALSYAPNLYIGAYGDEAIEYGTSGVTLSANSEGNWLLGGGTGTLNVNFKLTGANNLIIGNEYSSGTVHLTNTANDFTGDIYIKGSGNMLTYVEGALGSARVALSYGNTLALNDVNQLSILKDGAEGVLALSQSQDIDLTGKAVAIGANGSVTYTGTLEVDDTYRFGGKGDLTLDTELSSASGMELDGQGNSGSSVTFARENAYAGEIIAGGGLHLESANSAGDIAIHVGHESALAAAASIDLRQGAILHTDGQNIVVNNLSAQTGSTIRNNGDTSSLLQLNVDKGKSTIIANGVLLDANNNASLSLVKTGDGILEMGANTSWSGGLTVMAGTVKGSIAAGGIGAAGAAIYVNDGATLQLTSGATNDCKQFATTILQQKLSGSGVVSISNGNDMLFLSQSSGFAGQVKVTGNTRLYITEGAALSSQLSVSTRESFDEATIVVESGSQARVTPSIFSLSNTSVNSWADYVISGSAFAGASSGLVQSQDDGALLIDCFATVWGNVTLADDAMIASWSHNPTESRNFTGNYPYYCVTTGNYSNHYGVINRLGGFLRGQILGTVEADGTVSDLTIGGNEGMTITADSANTFGDLHIANGNGSNNSDSFALCLNGGAGKSQVSTALGTGSVNINAGLILRLAGTGTANMSDVVYTYENDISAGAGATLQSYNITNKLTGTVSMGGDTLNLKTANGGVLELAGGINGSGTLNVGADSKVILGSAASTMALTRSTTPQFSGTVAAEAGADITLASPSAVATDTAFTGTDSMTLRFGGTDDYTLGGITMNASSEDVTSVLTLNFDFSATPDADDANTWTTLSSSVTADKVLVALDLNMFNDIASGSYTLVSGTLAATEYAMADDLNGRLTLETSSGNLILVVGGDNRLYWRTDGASQEWNTADANWYQEGVTGNTTFAAGKDVVFDATGVAAGNSATARETVSLAADPNAGVIVVKDACYEISGEAALTGEKLAVGEQGDLKLSTASASFTNGVQVDNASLEVSGTALTANVSAANGGAFAMNNGASLAGNIEVNGGTAAIADVTVTGNISTQGSGSATLDTLTLKGEITTEEGGRIITASAYNGSSATYAVATLSGSLNWGGESGHSLSLTSGSLYLDGKVNLAELSVGAGLAATVWNATATSGAEKNLGTVKLGEGATFNIYDVSVAETDTTIDCVELSGSNAIVQDTYNASRIHINTLNLANGVDSAMLKLYKNSATAASTVFELGSADATPGNFSGTIELKATNGNYRRSVFLVLSNGEIAQNADINLAGVNDSSEAYIGLGINAENVTIAGLDSLSTIGNRSKVFSGTIEANVSWNTATSAPATVGDALRTLTIDTASGSSHEFYGEIMSNLNLVKTGAGTQKLLGTSANFNGSLSIEGGTLALGSSSALGTLAGLTVSDGATLDLSGIDFNSRTALSLAAGATGSFGSGAKLALGALEAETTYHIFDLSSGATLEGWDRLGAANFTLDGTSMLDMGRVNLALDSEAGSFAYYINSYDLVWNGGESDTWNREESNTPWLQSLGGTTSDTATYFANFDNVTFNSDASVTVGEDVSVGTLTLTDKASVTLDGSAVSADKVVIESGSKLKAAFASVLVPTKAFDIAEGAELEMYVPGTPSYTAEVSGKGTITMTGGGTLTWNPTDGTLGIGTLNITGGGTLKTASALTVETMNLGAGKTATLRYQSAGAGKDKYIANLNMANGAVLQTYDESVPTAATRIGTLTLQGDTATLKDTWNSGYTRVDTLKLDKAVSSSTLVLNKYANSANMSIFELGSASAAAGNFAGTIELKESRGGEGDRSAAVILSGAEIARNAVISISSATSGNTGSTLALGINTDKATIAGLSSASGLGTRAKLFSGSLASNEAWGVNKIDNGTQRTLTINTAAGKTHEFYGEVLGNLNLVKSGSGTQKFLGTAGSFDGSLTVEAGTLVLNSTASAMLSNASAVSLSGGMLDLSAIGFSESGGIELGGVMSVIDGTINLGNGLTTGTTYDIFTIGDGASLDWENMGDHLLVNGTVVSRYSGASLAVTDAGVATLSFSSLDKSSVYWVGGESGTWDYSSANWDLGAADADASNNVSFLTNDTVVFASDAAVTVADGVTVGGLTIEAGKHLTTTGGIELADSASITTGDGSKWTLANGTEQTLSKTQVSAVTALEIADGATLTVSDSAMAGYTATNLSGEGTVVLNLSATYGNKVDVGSGFKGETYVTGGCFSVTSAVVGETLRLAHGVNMQSDMIATVAADLILEGETTVHANKDNPITYSGSVTGDNGVYISQASSSHTFNGTVDLKEFQTASGAAVNFNGSTSLDKATINQTTVTFAGKTDIAEAAISGGITNFSNETTLTTLTTLTQTGGTVNANGTVEVTGKVTGTGGTLVLQSGELKLSYTGEAGNSISLLDGSKSGTATGTLRVAKDASVTVAGQIWGRKASSIVLEQGAELVNTEDAVKFSNRGTEEATFRTASTVNDAEYATDSTNWELTNGHLASTASGNKTLTNKLVNASVENAGSGHLTVSNSGNSITDVYATGGDLTVKQLQAGTALALGELVVSESQTVSLYTGDSTTEADVIVSKLAKFEQGATLNANLTLAEDSTLSLAEGPLAMGSTLTLREGIVLDAATLARIHANESTTLFTGVDGLTLGTDEVSSLTAEDRMLASTYFANLGSAAYVFTYTATTDGNTLSIMAIPEPTSSMLGLVGLVAFTLRRRRK